MSTQYISKVYEIEEVARLRSVPPWAQVTVGKRGRRGECYLSTPFVLLFVSLDWRLGGRGNALQSHFQIKVLSSFIYLFIFILCQKFHRAAEDHSKLASICRDESPGTFALRCPQHPHTPTSSLPVLPSNSITLRLFTSHCQTANLPLYDYRALWSSYWRSSSGSFGRRERGMKGERRCCLSALKPSAAEYSFIVTMPMCLNLTFWTFSPCTSVLCKDRRNVKSQRF